MTEQEVRKIVEITIEEYKRKGLILDEESAAYSDACELLKAYYDGGKQDVRISYAVQAVRFDPYFRVLQLYFEDHEKIETIARMMRVDASTIVRNKKRLCLEIYKDLI